MNISIIGGDLRIVELVKIFKKKENNIMLYGLENCEMLCNSNHITSLEETLKTADLIITSIPLSKDFKFINAIYTDKKIAIKDFFEISKNKKIITGNVNEEIKKYIKEENQNEIIDVLQDEKLAILNSIPTAEGAIQIAMENSTKTIHNSRCLILGFGRIGKILSKMLLGIGANVYCEARRREDIAWIQAYGYNAIHLKNLDENLEKFDFIFNTIPHLMLNKDNLKLIKKECLLIDLASKPGGIDFDEAHKLKLQTVWALALPGKVAPNTVAEYIYKIIEKYVN